MIMRGIPEAARSEEGERREGKKRRGKICSGKREGKLWGSLVQTHGRKCGNLIV